MNSKHILYALNGIDQDMILDAEQKRSRQKPPRWIRVVAVAAVICLVGLSVGTVMFVWKQSQPPVDTPESEQPETGTTAPAPDDPSPAFDTMVSPETLGGSALEFVIGSSAFPYSNGGDACPPDFSFDSSGIIVKATVVENLPDVYYMLDVSSTFQPTAYRLVELHTEQVIQGENVPSYFLYLIKESLFVDLSVYDSLLISMVQVGTESYVMRNSTLNQIQAFSLPVFGDYEDHPDLGNMIAFTDGIFDESLWQTPSWIYGYQFGRRDLDEQSDRLVVFRGCTEEEAIQAITRDIQANGVSHSLLPSVVSLQFKTEEARAALDYVKPFENGVFSQTLQGHAAILFRRFIHGCQTEETVTIDLLTEEVTYSSVRYTEEDIARMADISDYISGQAAAYAEQLPTPSHTDTDGKKLASLSLYGWYVKVGDAVYGVVKTVWIYRDEDGWRMVYYDDAYTLCDLDSDTMRSISRDELLALTGDRNVYLDEWGEYGTGIELPT